MRRSFSLWTWKIIFFFLVKERMEWLITSCRKQKGNLKSSSCIIFPFDQISSGSQTNQIFIAYHFQIFLAIITQLNKRNKTPWCNLSLAWRVNSRNVEINCSLPIRQKWHNWKHFSNLVAIINNLDRCSS
jgi:hypothetical protein